MVQSLRLSLSADTVHKPKPQVCTIPFPALASWSLQIFLGKVMDLPPLYTGNCRKRSPQLIQHPLTCIKQCCFKDYISHSPLFLPAIAALSWAATAMKGASSSMHSPTFLAHTPHWWEEQVGDFAIRWAPVYNSWRQHRISNNPFWVQYCVILRLRTSM